MSSKRTQQITPCAGAMLQYFGCMGVTWNARTQKNVWADTLRRNGYSVRSRYSKIKKGASVGGIRKTLTKIAMTEGNIMAFVVRVKGHVLVINCEGQTIVDTAPRKADRRKVISLYAIMKK